MFNTHDIMETLKMIDHQKLDVRTITMGISLFNCVTDDEKLLCSRVYNRIARQAENLVKGLGFHFRTVKLAAGDCSASMARTYDIEIQIPSMQGYKEVSSVSNARDYQARRGNIRFRRESTGKPEFLHTLNGSGLATSRIFPAMVEQNQLKDGSVKVPEVLQKYLGGLEVITR